MKYSQEPLKIGLFVLVLSGLLLTQYQNCSSSRDPSPFDMPLTISGTVNPGQIGLNGLVVRASGVPIDTLLMTGSCGGGPYSQYSVELQIVDGSGLRPVANVPCDHGRFHFSTQACAHSGSTTLVINGQIIINGYERPIEGTSLNKINFICR